MSLSDKIQNAKTSDSLFKDMLPEHRAALRKAVDISIAIKQNRIARNMNQEQFAAFCGVSQAMVSKWESGDYNFSIVSWGELANKLGIPFDPAGGFIANACQSRGLKGASSSDEKYQGKGKIVKLSDYRVQSYVPSELKEN